jgi:hypothetical protein
LTDRESFQSLLRGDLEGCIDDRGTGLLAFAHRVLIEG